MSANARAEWRQREEILKATRLLAKATTDVVEQMKILNDKIEVIVELARE